MSSVPAIYWENPWYRVVRCLVVLLVAALERRIARMIADMEALPEDVRFDAEFARLDARCAYFEELRDRYRAWLDDPSVELPRAYDWRGALWRWSPRPRLAGERAIDGVLAGLARLAARCRCALLPALARP